MTKAIENSIGASNVSEPRHIVDTQLNTFTPVGIVALMVYGGFILSGVIGR
jgi:hypothetical protein